MHGDPIRCCGRALRSICCALAAALAAGGCGLRTSNDFLGAPGAAMGGSFAGTGGPSAAGVGGQASPQGTGGLGGPAGFPGQPPQGLGGLCSACENNSQCGAAADLCLTVRSTGERFCARDCAASACPDGYACITTSSGMRQCVPMSGTCVDPGPAGMGGIGGAAGASGTLAPPPPVTGGVPGTPHCQPVSVWHGMMAQFEDRVLDLVNQRRSMPAICGSVELAPAPPLTPNAALRCSARLHSKDMAERNFFEHTNPDGKSASRRMTDAGYRWRASGENIAFGQSTPEEVVQTWMESPGHCMNIMGARFQELGVGAFLAQAMTQWGPRDRIYWTQNFGSR